MAGDFVVAAHDFLVQVGSVRILERQKAADKRKQNDSETPDVGERAHVFFTRNHFRCCIARRATRSFEQATISHKVSQPKIHNLDVLLRIEEEVFRPEKIDQREADNKTSICKLEVSMDNVATVAIINSVHNLMKKATCIALLHSTMVDDIVKELATRCVAHD